MRKRLTYKVPGIYKIVNNYNNKVYVGYTTDLSFRKGKHFHELRYNIHKNPHLQAAWNEYGEKVFEFIIIEKCEKELLYSMEHYWCNMLDAHNRERGYNIKPTDPNGICNEIAEETRKKMGLKSKGYKHSEETKKLLSKLHTGNKYRVGHTATKETRLLMSKIRTGRKLSEKARQAVAKGQINSKGIKLIHKETGLIFASITEAAKWNNMSRLTLQDQLNFNRKCVFTYACKESING